MLSPPHLTKLTDFIQIRTLLGPEILQSELDNPSLVASTYFFEMTLNTGLVNGQGEYFHYSLDPKGLFLYLIESE